MGEVQPVELRMAGQPRAAAALATPAVAALQGQAVAAETMLRIVDSDAH
jgi:hypothetical protein